MDVSCDNSNGGLFLRSHQCGIMSYLLPDHNVSPGLIAGAQCCGLASKCAQWSAELGEKVIIMHIFDIIWEGYNPSYCHTKPLTGCENMSYPNVSVCK